MASEFPVLKIRADGPTPQQITEVSLDGQRLYPVSVTLSLGSQSLTTATIEIEVTPDLDVGATVAALINRP